MGKRLISILILIGLFGSVRAQKGDKSIAAGVFIALPSYTDISYYDYSFHTSVGIEAIGQYNFTEKSAGLAQLQLTRFAAREYICERYDNGYCVSSILRPASFNSLSLKGGYRYQFTPSGFYANALIGIEGGRTNYYKDTFFPVVLGAGKRFPLKDVYFLDVGIDYVNGYIERWNIKAVFSVLNKSQEF